MPLYIAICGYGTAAQAAALCLGTQGHAISIFERSPVLAPVGAGFLATSRPRGVTFAGSRRTGVGLQRGALFEILKKAYPGVDSINTVNRTLSGLQEGYFGLYQGIDVDK